MKNTTYLIAFLLLIISGTHVAAQKFGKVTIEELTQEAHPTYPDADAAFLVKNCSTFYDFGRNDNYIVSEYWYRVKIYKEDAISIADVDRKLFKSRRGKVQMNGIKCRTHNAVNGKVETTKLEKKDIYRESYSDDFNLVRFALPNTKVGSIVDIKFTIRSPFLYSFPKHYFQHDIPVEQSKYSVIIPEYFGVTPVATGLIHLNKTSEKVLKGQKVDFEVSQVPPMEDDEYVLNTNDYRSSIKFELGEIFFPGQEVQRFSSTWQTISENLEDDNSFGKILNKQIGDTETFMNEVKTMPEADRVKSIYDYVRENFEWNKDWGIYADQSRKKLIESKVGNCGDINLLLISMLKKADIECYPLVTKTRTSGLLNQLYPSLTELDYVIAVAKMEDGKYLFLDATSKYIPLGQLPLRAINKKGLLVNGAESQIINIPNNNLIYLQSVEKYDLNTEELCLDGTGVLALRKFAATKQRIKNDENEDDEDNQDLEEDEYDEEDGDEEDEDLEDVDIRENISTQISVSGMEDIYEPIKSESELKIYESVQSIGDQIFINAFVNNDFEKNPFESEKREYPAFFNSKYNMTYITNINNPKGYKIESLPESLNLRMDNNMGSFSYVLTPLDDMISIRSIFKVNETFFTAENYDMLRRFFGAILDKQKEKIIYKKI